MPNIYDTHWITDDGINMKKMCVACIHYDRGGWDAINMCPTNRNTKSGARNMYCSKYKVPTIQVECEPFGSYYNGTRVNDCRFFFPTDDY